MTFEKMRVAGRATAGLVLAIALGVGVGLAPANAADAGSGTPNPYSAAALQRQSAAQDALQASKAHDSVGVPTGIPAAKADDGTLGTKSLAQAAPFTADASVTGADFSAGNIISDNLFYAGSALTATQVQTFLTAVGSSCTSGANCLKNYTVTTAGRAATSVCSAYAAGTNESAATIIAKAGLACGISQAVLLTLIQKESGLVTANNPSNNLYEQATGYACPDSTGCDMTYFGFFNQVYDAASQLKTYSLFPSTFNYYPVGQTSKIAYSPTASCGTGNVTIWNNATAALYYYTPYQPDPAALANLYGTGDACSSYGNRNFWTIYNSWFGSPTAGEVPSVTRESGADRYATAVAISQAAYPAGTTPVPVVYIATGTDFPDALSAAPAAAAAKGPLLLVSPTAVPAEVTQELARLQPQRIVVVGGTGAVSQAAYTALAATPSLGGDPTKITRVAGIDRYDTSRQIASTFPAPTTTAYLATGADFPDALSAGAAAGSNKEPVVLINGAADAVDAPTLALLHTLGVTTIDIVGGTGVVSAAFANSLTGFTVTRLSGIDRYATSAAVNNAAFHTASRVYLATGTAFPDALAGAAAAGAAHSPLYVVAPTCVQSASAAGIFSSGASTITLLGGTGALGSGAAKLAACP